MSAYVYQQTPEVLEALRLAAEEADGGVIAVEMLWLGGLQTQFGGLLLDELGVGLGSIRARVLRREGPPGYDGAADEALRMAARMTHMTDPGPDCCEQLLHGLLLDRATQTARYLDRLGVDRRQAAYDLQLRIRAGDTLSCFDIDDVYGLAMREGRSRASEADYLRTALWQPGLAAAMLAELGVDLPALAEEAATWPGDRGFLPSNRVNVGRVEPFHLLMSLGRCEPVLALMRQVGVVGYRLQSTLQSLRPGYPRAETYMRPEMVYVKPACEEAQRLGAVVVGAEHLLLGLLADPLNSASRALRRAGLDLRVLRARLEAATGPGATAREMDFAPEVRAALALAIEAWGGKDADAAYILHALLANSQVLGPDQEAVEALLPAVLDGTLDAAKPLELGGLRLGQPLAEVLALKGEPICREVTQAPYESLTLTDCSVIVDSTTGLVRSIYGPELAQNGVPMLRKGDSWIKAEEVLGVRQRSPLCKGPPQGVSALVASGRVGFLCLSNIPYEDPPAADGAQE